MLKKLIEILPNSGGYEIIGGDDVEVGDLFLDSRKVLPKGLFAAIKGVQADGHHYVDQAIDNGACVILVENLPEKPNPKVVWVVTTDSRLLLAKLADKFFESPSKRVKVIAVTGTNGKTSVVWMLYDVMKMLGIRVAMLSTIENRVGETRVPSELTTPDVISVHRYIHQAWQSGCTHLVMEASSHALDQGRLDQVDVEIGVFTNLTRDHLDYHGDMLSYLNSKKLLFDRLSAGARALVNMDDRNARTMLQNCRVESFGYGLQSICAYRMRLLSMDMSGMELEWCGHHLFTRVVGQFNAYNIAAVIGCLDLLGMDTEVLLRSISMIKGPEGRLEVLLDHGGVPRAVVDYAHTPDAIDNVLSTIRQLKLSSAKMIVVVGAGGDRDRGKRPLMARAAVRGSDRLILTSDNPRNEDPNDILHDMQDGFNDDEKNRTLVVADRQEAIKLAFVLADENDLVIVLGKGHEKYQEVRGKRWPFDDKQEVYKHIL